MVERSTISITGMVVGVLAVGALGGFGALLLRPTVPLQLPHADLVMLIASGDLPPGDKIICAPPGAELRLNSGARLGETKQVLDCGNEASAKPIKIRHSEDAGIRGPFIEKIEGSYSLTTDGQGIGFIRVPGHWQEF